jgi:hypothetical protein
MVRVNSNGLIRGSLLGKYYGGIIWFIVLWFGDLKCFYSCSWSSLTIEELYSFKDCLIDGKESYNECNGSNQVQLFRTPYI